MTISLRHGHRFWSLLMSLVVAFFVGCGGTNTPPTITVSLTPASALSLDQGQSKDITAALTNDSGSKGVTWTVSGSSCSGNACGNLSNTTATAVTYTAPAGGASNLTVTVTATSAADNTKSASLTITVTPAPSVTTTAISSGTVNVAFSFTLQESGGVGPYTWSISSGTLPTGLTLNASTGAISGTPTTAGTANLTFKVADSGNPSLSATKALSLTISAPALAVTTTSLPGADAGLAYTVTVGSSGGTAPVTWSISVGTLPAGLTLNGSTGQISGTPTTAGTSNFTVQATDSSTPVQNATKALSITVSAQLTVSTTSLTAGTQGAAYSASITSTGGTGSVAWSISAGTLPAGLSPAASTGVISGTPNGAAGTSNFTVRATDSLGQTATKALSIVINPAPLSIQTTSLTNGTANAAYSATVQATGGTPPYTFSVTVGTLPAGLSINSSTGVISGTPTTAGTSNFTIHVVDSSGPAQTADKALSITINPSGPNNNLLSGTYAFSFSGWDATGSVTMAGSFAADGLGSVTGGLLDVSRVNTRSTNISITGGSFSIGADRRGQLSLTSSLGTWTFRLALDATGSKARFIQFDASGTRGSGVIKKQDTTKFTLASITGDYAFGMTGYTDSASRTSTVGALTHNGTGGITAGSLDASVSGAATGQVSITGGSFSTPNATYGRGALAVNATIPGLPATLNFVYYVVSGSEMFVLNNDAAAASVPRFSGSALKQNKPGGGFALGALNGISIFAFNAYDVSHSQANVAIGQITANGSGTITSASIDQNADGTILTASSNGTYTMAASGRGVVIITGLRQEVVYVVDTGKGFLLEGTTADPGNDSGLGFFEPQTGGPFSGTTLTGQFQFGTIEPTTTLVTNVGGAFVISNAANPPIIGTSDSSDASPSLDPDHAFTAVYSTSVASTGRGVVSVTPATQTPFPIIIWAISPTKFLGVSGDATDTNSAIFVFEK